MEVTRQPAGPDRLCSFNHQVTQGVWTQLDVRACHMVLKPVGNGAEHVRCGRLIAEGKLSLQFVDTLCEETVLRLVVLIPRVSAPAHEILFGSKVGIHVNNEIRKDLPLQVLSLALPDRIMQRVDQFQEPAMVLVEAFDTDIVLVVPFEERHSSLLSWGRNTILDDLAAGLITGRAPLFERFVVGNSSMLRGWNKFELDPLGGSRLLHNSVEYRYRLLDIFYDGGAIWDPGETAVFRHSIGLGVRQDGFCVALAFPVRGGHIEPVFMVGMNY